MKWNEAIRSLEECERALRKLMTEAAAEGDYVSVVRIADLAKAIVGLAAEGRSVPSAEPPHSDVRTGAPSDAGRKGHAAASPYPRFFRRGDELVKVGWSKKNRSEYNHRAPRRAVIATAAAIRRAGANGKMFNGDALLPLKDAGDGPAFPDYQAYVSLAWLTCLGVVEQHGVRGGYTLVAGKQIDGEIMKAWPELQEWRG